jgi:hypothetical protein
MQFYAKKPDSPASVGWDSDDPWDKTARTGFEGHWGWDIHTFYPLHGWQTVVVDARRVPLAACQPVYAWSLGWFRLVILADPKTGPAMD